jgi:ferredoxin
MKIAVVGSGPTGVGAATILAERGFEVDLFDGGARHEASPDELGQHAQAARNGDYIPPPDISKKGPWFGDLIRRRLSTLRLRKAILGSSFVFEGVDRETPMTGAWLPRSLAIGGLSNVWGTACYPLAPSDYADWPIEESELAPWFDRAAELLGVSAERDGLADAYPMYGAPSPVARSNWQKRQAGSGLEGLLQGWRARGGELRQAGMAAGRSRLALSRADEGGEDSCVSCGSCMSGCPVGAMWTSTKGLQSLLRSGKITHKSGAIVDRVVSGAGGETVWAPGGQREQTAYGPYDAVVLAAGAVSTYAIARRSCPDEQMAAKSVRILDNDLYVFPLLLNGHRHRGEPIFALSEAALAFANGAEGRLVHLQLYRPSGPLLGPLNALAAKSPWLRRVVGRFTSRIVLGFMYLHSDQSRNISARLIPDTAGRPSLAVDARETASARAAAKRSFARLWALRKETGLTPLSAFRLKGDAGFSGHIGGTLPHRSRPGPLETDTDGRIFADRRIYAADLSVFPAMPAQNPTFVAVANAMRIASRI